MPVEKRLIDLEVKSIEKGENLPLKISFSSGEIGEFYEEVGEEYYDLFMPGKKYLGEFGASGLPDFIGEEDKWENVCTISYALKKIIHPNKGIVLYEPNRGLSE